MTFSEDYSDAAEDLEGYYGQAVTYEDPVTPSVSVRATVHPDRRERRKNQEGGWDWVTVRDVIFFGHTSPSVTPRHDATVTIGSDVYGVLEIRSPSPGRTEVKMHRAESVEIARKGYRGR